MDRSLTDILATGRVEPSTASSPSRPSETDSEKDALKQQLEELCLENVMLKRQVDLLENEIDEAKKI